MIRHYYCKEKLDAGHSYGLMGLDSSNVCERGARYKTLLPSYFAFDTCWNLSCSSPFYFVGMESNSNRSVSSSERSTLYSWQSLPSYEDVGWEVFQLDKDYWLGAGEGDQGTNRWQHIHNSIYFISYIEMIGFAGWHLKLAEQGYILAFFLLADESAML